MYTDGSECIIAEMENGSIITMNVTEIKKLIQTRLKSFLTLIDCPLESLVERNLRRIITALCMMKLYDMRMTMLVMIMKRARNSLTRILLEVSVIGKTSKLKDHVIISRTRMFLHVDNILCLNGQATANNLSSVMATVWDSEHAIENRSTDSTGFVAI